MIVKQQLTTAWWLLIRDIRVLYKKLGNSILNAILVPMSFIIIGGYIMPALGMAANYGSFMVIGSLVTMCFNMVVWWSAAPLIADLESDRSISYTLTLPLSSGVLVITKACGFAIRSCMVNILTLPLGKLLLWHSFSFDRTNWWLVILMYLTINMCFAFMSLAIAFYVDSMEGFGQFWLRCGAHLIWLGGFQFPWATLKNTISWLAWLNLANPVMYAYEGMRAAVLGQEGYVNLWVCLGMLMSFSVLFGVLAHYNVKRKLDCL